MRPIVFLSARVATSDDVEIMLRLCYPSSRSGPEEREVQRSLWERLWRCSVLQGVVMEDLSHQDKPQVVGFMVLCLALPKIHDQLVRPGGPHIMQGLAEALADAEEAIPTEEQIGIANAGDGLDSIFLWIGYAEGFSHEVLTGLRSRVVAAFNEFFQGNRLRRITIESANPVLIERFRAYGYTSIRDEAGTTVLSMDRHAGLNGADIASQRLFSYDPPVLGFTSSQRAILLLARQGFTDQEISAAVGKSPDSIKKRWGGIYARFAAVFPGRLPSAGDGSRGMEKRRTLLAYLRDRPEELRPYQIPKEKG